MVGEVTSGNGAVRDTRDDLYVRWRTMQLLAPVFTMVERGAPRAGFDHRRYDLPQLALRTIDFVVVNQASVDGSVSPERMLDHLSQFARRMGPDDPARPWTRVAQLVINSLLNDGRPHEAAWRVPAAGQEEWSDTRTYRFRLLRLVDGDDGTAVAATDEAIVLYLRALQTDLANQAMALKLMVELQMAQGEFDRALISAREATKTARGLSASLREKLDDTRRDIRSVDWAGEMPTWLTSVLDQIGAQLERDRQLKGLAVTAGEDPDAASDCQAIIDEVRQSEDVWIRLERLLQSAIPTFLASQEIQRFQPGGLSSAIEAAPDILRPAITSPLDVFDSACGELTSAVIPPQVMPQWDLDELCRQLLRQPISWERSDPVLDEPGDLGDSLGDSIPDDVARVATDVLTQAIAEPHRLSSLLAAARQRVTEVREPDRLCDVLWGAVLWTFVADSEGSDDDLPARPDLAAALQALTAAADGIRLIDERYVGLDLLIGTQTGFDRLEASMREGGQVA